jgi:hypothetical protein
MWRTSQFFGGFTEIAGGSTEKTVQVNLRPKKHNPQCLVLLRVVRRLPVEFSCTLTGLPLGAGI